MSWGLRAQIDELRAEVAKWEEEKAYWKLQAEYYEKWGPSVKLRTAAKTNKEQ